ncbi:hypothetical protein UM89_20850 [Bacillus subtilis]|nr:hypothetical protein UM89_20850 [Bacillus subtilis]
MISTETMESNAIYLVFPFKSLRHNLIFGGEKKATGHRNSIFGETAITFWLGIKNLDYMLRRK